METLEEERRFLFPLTCQRCGTTIISGDLTKEEAVTFVMQFMYRTCESGHTVEPE